MRVHPRRSAARIFFACYLTPLRHPERQPESMTLKKQFWPQMNTDGRGGTPLFFLRVHPRRSAARIFFARYLTPLRHPARQPESMTLKKQFWPQMNTDGRGGTPLFFLRVHPRRSAARIFFACYLTPLRHPARQPESMTLKKQFWPQMNTDGSGWTLLFFMRVHPRRSAARSFFARYLTPLCHPARQPESMALI